MCGINGGRRGSETVHQPQLDREKTSIILLLVVLALSSLGFAIYGLVLGPNLSLDQPWHRTEEVQIIRPEAPHLGVYGEFWQEAGYYIVQRDQSYKLQDTPQLSKGDVWIQGREKWVLLPQSYDLNLSSSMFSLFDDFLAAGWLMQIERTAHGYTIGFMSNIPDDEQKVLGLVWEIELLNPHNYNEYMGGMIPVMGDLFDPQAFMRGTPEAPVLALIIDDWGYNTSAMQGMLAYPFPLTLAVLPHLDLSLQASERGLDLGHEVILHQPMEAHSGLDMGPGAISVEMEPEDIEIVLKENLASLPVVVGVNNHMGSLVTEDYGVMTRVLETLREMDLFFVDSRTSNASVVAEAALDVGIPFGVNNLFIDNESDVDSIKAQLRQALDLAKQRGRAVAIGHVRPATVEALWQMIPELLGSGVLFAPVSSLLQNQ